MCWQIQYDSLFVTCAMVILEGTFWACLTIVASQAVDQGISRGWIFDWTKNVWCLFSQISSPDVSSLLRTSGCALDFVISGFITGNKSINWWFSVASFDHHKASLWWSLRSWSAILHKSKNPIIALSRNISGFLLHNIHYNNLELYIADKYYLLITHTFNHSKNHYQVLESTPWKSSRLLLSYLGEPARVSAPGFRHRRPGRPDLASSRRPGSLGDRERSSLGVPMQMVIAWRHGFRMILYELYNNIID